jgi:hypothetical protein
MRRGISTENTWSISFTMLCGIASTKLRRTRGKKANRGCMHEVYDGVGMRCMMELGESKRFQRADGKLVCNAGCVLPHNSQ